MNHRPFPLLKLLFPVRKAMAILLAAGPLMVTGSCSPHGERILVSGVGPEDLVAVPSGVKGGKMIVTGTAPRRLPTESRGGFLEVYHPGDSGGFGKLPGTEMENFTPLGLCHVPEPDGPPGHSLIYVANRSGDPVKVFSITDGAVRSCRSIAGPEGGVPNSIAVHPDGRIYISTRKPLYFSKKDNPLIAPLRGNAGSSRRVKEGISVFVPAEGGGKGSWRTVLTGVLGSNGVALSPDGDSLLVCGSVSRTLYRLPLDRRTGLAAGAPVPLFENLPFNPDNLSRTPDGGYIVCGQKSTLASIAELLTTMPVSPGGAWRFRLEDGKATGCGDVSHLLEGYRKSPSTCLVSGGMVYVGQPFAKGVLARPFKGEPGKTAACPPGKSGR